MAPTKVKTAETETAVDPALYDDLPASDAKPTQENEVADWSFKDLLESYEKEGALAQLSGSPKERLIGVPFIITRMTFHKDDQGRKYVFVQVKTQDNENLSFTDGSTGVMAQLVSHWRKSGGQTTGILIRNGLRKSEYTHKETGQPATTFYIA
jgi:hypothetical protein